MNTATATTLEFVATDTSGQKKYRASGVSPSATIGEVVKSLLARIGLATENPDGSPITYGARLKREGRNLHGAELAGDALQPGDEVQLHPRIHAG
jgi:hypothetical protein